MKPETSGSRRRLEVWMRGHVRQGAYEHQQTTLSKLRHLEANGDIAEFAVHTWEGCVTIADSDADPSASVLGKVEEFEAWAEQNGQTLQPAFERHEVSSTITGGQRSKLALPIVCLALYEDDELRAVHPCSEEDTTHTVEDCLAMLDAVESS